MRSSPTPDLADIYRQLRRHFGEQDWWPGDSPFEVVIGAILTQRTSWRNVEQAIANLKAARALSPGAIAGMRPSQLAKLIRPAGYFNQKAARLKEICNYLLSRADGEMVRFKKIPTKKLRVELLAINGVGPETADSILLYALNRPVFVVDAYTRRALKRIGIRSDSTDDYAGIQSLFHNNLPRSEKLFNDYHAQWVALGKNYCRTKPLCVQCPITKVCKTGKAVTANQ